MIEKLITNPEERRRKILCVEGEGRLKNPKNGKEDGGEGRYERLYERMRWKQRFRDDGGSWMRKAHKRITERGSQPQKAMN
jgi:hypothetical protein